MRAVGGGGNGFVAVGEAVVIKDINHQRVAPVAGLAVVKRILHRRNGDIEPRGDVAVGATVGDGVGHLRHVAVPVGDRNKGIAAVGVEGQRAVARKRGGLAGGPGGIAHRKRFHRQRVAVQVAGARQQIFAVGKRCVFRRAAGFSQADLRRVVDQSEGDRRGFGFAAAGDGIGEGIGADIAAGRRVNHLAVADANRTVSAVGLAGNRFIAVAEFIVGENVDGHRRTRVGRQAVVKGVFYRRDGYLQLRRGRAVGAAINHPVGHRRHRTVPVGDRDKSIAAVGVDGQFAIPGEVGGLACGKHRADAADGVVKNAQRIAIRVGIVQQQVLRGGAGQRRIFRRADVFTLGDRGGVIHLNRDRRGFGHAAAGDGIGERIAADVARGVRGINHLAVVDNHGTINALGDRRDRFIAVAEAVVAQHVDGFRLARMGGGGVAHRVRHRCNAHADALRRAPVAGLAAVEGALQILRAARGADAGIGGTGAVGDAHRQAARHRAVVVGQRHKAQLGRGEQHQRVGFAVACAKRSPGRAVGRVLPVAEACVGGVADDRHIADSAAGVAAASNSRLVVGGVAVAAKNRGQRFANWRIFLHGQRRRANRRTVVDVSDAG